VSVLFLSFIKERKEKVSCKETFSSKESIAILLDVCSVCASACWCLCVFWISAFFTILPQIQIGDIGESQSCCFTIPLLS
jgi:hypothetical protein